MQFLLEFKILMLANEKWAEVFKVINTSINYVLILIIVTFGFM